MSVSVLLWSEDGFRTGLLADLEAAGAQVVGEVQGGESLVHGVVRHAPKLVVVRHTAPGDALFLATQALAEQAPVAVLAFVDQADAESTERAVGAGVHAWVANGYAAHRLPVLMALAQARQHLEQGLREALRAVSERLEERKAVERAKGILMSARKVSDDDAFHLLRTASMHSNQRLGQVAQHIIQSAHFAEAVNRSGQQRMLSQRLVKHWLLRLAGVQVVRHTALQAESVQRIDANLQLLGKQLSDPSFGEPLEQVVARWKTFKKLLKAEPSPEQLHAVNTAAEHLLQDAERLTASLETAGKLAPLRLLNMAGRQRMLSQRFAKAALMGVLDSEEAQLQDRAEAEAARQAFERNLTALNGLPLSTPDIRRTLDTAAQGWQQVLSGADHVRRPAGRDRLLRLEGLAAASESLLDDFEQLSAQYERSMQMLMG